MTKNKVAVVRMEDRKREAEYLLRDMFTDIIPDSKRNRMYVSIIVFCLGILSDLMKREDAKLF